MYNLGKREKKWGLYLAIRRLKAHHGLLVIFVAISAYLAFSFLFANYAIFSVFITMEVVFLLAFVIP